MDNINTTFMHFRVASAWMACGKVRQGPCLHATKLLFSRGTNLEPKQAAPLNAWPQGKGGSTCILLTAAKADTAVEPSSAQTSDSSLPETDVIEFEVRPVEGGIAVTGEAVSFKQEDGKLYALNEDGEAFGIVAPKIATIIGGKAVHAEAITRNIDDAPSVEIVLTETTNIPPA